MIQRMLRVVEEIARQGTGTLGFGFLDLQTGEVCCLHPDTLFPTASVFKIFVLLELYRQIEQGILREDQRIAATPENAALGSGVLKRMCHGANLSLHDHAVLMMMLSDNTASDLLFELVGARNILEHIIRPLELQNTRIELGCSQMIRLSKQSPDRWNSDFFHCCGEQTDCTTPAEILKLLQALHGGSLLNPENNRRVLELNLNPKYFLP